MVEIRLLGPVELRAETSAPVPLGPPQQRCVLAVLALTPGRLVPTTALIDRVWSDRLPRGVANALHTNVSRLRTVLRSVGVGLPHRDGGYLLDLDAARIDLHRARQLAGDARGRAGRGDAGLAGAAAALTSACALWRGTPLSGIKGEWASRTRESLELERRETVIQRFEVALRLGRHESVIAELAAERLAHPLSEPLAALHMLALYRCGRQAEALEAYARARERTIAELGDEPGRKLQRLHEQMLRRDRALELLPGQHNGHDDSASRVPSRPHTMTTPAQLPPDPGVLIGRTDALEWLDTLLTPGSPRTRAATPILTIDGMAGVGKTALAVHWAHRIRARFPDGQLYTDLRGYSAGPPAAPAEVLARFLHALGVAPAAVPAEPEAAAASYRSLTADRRLLVVLDNAASAEQVRPLIPASAGCLVLVTSRGRLTGLVAHDGAQRITLDTLPPEQSVDLLSRLLGDRLAEQAPQAKQLAELCGHLPLALRIAAAHLLDGDHRLDGYLRQLREQGRLATLDLPGDESMGVGAALKLSYARLGPPERRMFRLLGLGAGEYLCAPAAAALADTGLTQARRQLAELVRCHLLSRGQPDRYRLHDLVREYASQLAVREESSTQADAARIRLLEFYLHTAVAATGALEPGLASYIDVGEPGRPDLVRAAGADRDWLNQQWHNLRAAIRLADEHGHDRYTWRLTRAIWRHSYHSHLLGDMFDPLRTALAAADRLGDDRAAAIIHNCLAGAHHRAGDLRQAARHLEATAAIHQQHGDRRGLTVTHNNLALLHRELGQFDEAIRLGKRVLAARLRDAGPVDLGLSLLNLGIAYRRLGRHPEALRCLRRQLAACRGSGDLAGLADTLGQLGATRAELGHHRQAHRLLSVAVKVKRRLGIHGATVWELTWLAALHRAQGDHRRGLRCIRQALELLADDLNRPLECMVRNEYGRLLHATGDLPGALAQHRDVLAVATTWHLRYEQAQALEGIAVGLRDTDPTSATQHRHRARELHRAMLAPQPVAESAIVSIGGAGRST